MELNRVLKEGMRKWTGNGHVRRVFHLHISSLPFVVSILDMILPPFVFRVGINDCPQCSASHWNLCSIYCAANTNKNCCKGEPRENEDVWTINGKILVVRKKGKVVPVLNLIKHYAMKAYGGVDVYIHIFLTSAVVGGEWSASRPGRFTPGKELPVPIV
jgi:hypothetical protein